MYIKISKHGYKVTWKKMEFVLDDNNLPYVSTLSAYEEKNRARRRDMSITNNKTKPSKNQNGNKFKTMHSSPHWGDQSNCRPTDNREVHKHCLRKATQERGMLQPLTHASHRPPALRWSKEYSAKQITQLNPYLVLVLLAIDSSWREGIRFIEKKD